MTTTTGLIASEAYTNFINSLESPKSRINYKKAVTYFMRFLGISIDGYDQLLKYGIGQDSNKLLLEAKIRDFILYQKTEKRSSPHTIAMYLQGVRHFYDMNDVVLNWKKINRFRPKLRSVTDDLPYRRQQIKRMLNVAGLREKIIILLMCSAGLRLGALPLLKYEDLIPINDFEGGIYKIRVYANELEEYCTYCTPECRKAIGEYIAWRQRIGERINSKSPLVRKSFNIEDPLQVKNPRALSEIRISGIMNHLLHSTGLRERQHTTEKRKISERTRLMQCHGFRKFFDTTCTIAGVSPIFVEKLMGHELDGNKPSYFKPTEDDILKGNGDSMLGYIAAIPSLIINATEEENDRLKKRLQKVIVDTDHIADLRLEIEKIKLLICGENSESSD